MPNYHSSLANMYQGNLPSASSSTSLALQPTGLSQSQLKKSLTQSLGSLLSWKTTRSLKLLQSSSRVAAVLNATMPEEYDGQHRIVSEKIYSNRELHLEEFMRIAIFLLSNNRLLGHDKHDPTPEGYEGENKDKLTLNLLRISGGLNISNMRHLVSTKGATAEVIVEKIFASAVRSSDFQAIESMLEAGMSPDSIVTDGAGEDLSPLVHAACISNNELSVKISRLLLLHKADLNKSQAGKSALGCAIRSRNEELVRILISNGVQLPPRALAQAFDFRCSKNIFEMILDAGVDIEERLNTRNATTVFGYIVHRRNTEFAQLLLSRGANPDSLHPVDFDDPGFGESLRRYQTTALGLAASKGDIPTMKILLAAHATVNQAEIPNNYLHPLVLAVTQGGKEATRLLLEAGANLQAAERHEPLIWGMKKTLFELALEANDLPMCQILLANGAEAGAQPMEDYYSSQLWEHVKQNDTETVALLLQFGARANDLRGGLPNSALGLAITQGNWTMISLLQGAGATGVGHIIPFIASVETAQFLEQSNLLSQLLSANGLMILIEAILSQNEPLTSLLLGYGIDRQDRDIENVPSKLNLRVSTPMEAALCCGNLSLAQIIISHGGQVTEAEINAIMWRVGMTQDHSVLLRFINMFGPFSLSAPTAVAMAVCSNDEAAIRHLLEAGVDLHGFPEVYIDRHYREILEPKLAIYPFTNELMGWWNFNHAKKTSGVFHSVLELAVIYGNRQIFQALLRATTWTREEKGRAFSISLHFWDRRFVQDLLDVGADIHQEVFLIDTNMKRPSNPVKLALSEGNTPLLWTLMSIDRILDNINGRTYMQYAIRLGNIEQLKILLTADTAVNRLLQNSREEPLLQTAVKAGKVEMVSLLLQAGVDIDEIHEPTYSFRSRGTALHLAGEAGNVELMRILLKAGASIRDIPTPKYPNTTLWHAVEGGDVDVVNMVLAAGADVNGPPLQRGGMAPLQQAANQGNMELVDLFLKAGADVNQDPASHTGATALQFAAIQGYIGVARKLLDAGASVQAPRAERYGRTALEGAAEHGRLDMLQLLLNEGLLIDGNGRIEYIRAIKLAQRNGHHAVAKFLKSFSYWTECGTKSQCWIGRRARCWMIKKKLRNQTEYQDEKIERVGRCS